MNTAASQNPPREMSPTSPSNMGATVSLDDDWDLSMVLDDNISDSDEDETSVPLTSEGDAPSARPVSPNLNLRETLVRAHHAQQSDKQTPSVPCPTMPCDDSSADAERSDVDDDNTSRQVSTPPTMASTMSSERPFIREVSFCTSADVTPIARSSIPNLIPPQERRMRMHTHNAENSFNPSFLLDAPFFDLDKASVFVGSALIRGAVHPCKITLSRLGEAGLTPVRVPFGGKEVTHHGVYEILSIDNEAMEWVGARTGRLPFGRAPVEGGYDNEMNRLYYAVATIDGCMVPGKTWENGVGANFPWNGEELVMRDGYDVLCWRRQFYAPRRSQDPRAIALAPFKGNGGKSPVYVISVPLRGTRQPGKATVYDDTTVRVRLSYSGKEVETDWNSSEQPLEIISIDPDSMDWIPSHHGRLPLGVQPVEGGYDKDDQRLYHAIHEFDGRIVPGKTGEHLRGARFPWGGKEQVITHGYKILCWKRMHGHESDTTHTWLVPPPPRMISLINTVYIGIAHCTDGSRHPGSVVKGSPGRIVFPRGGRAVLDFSGSYDILDLDEGKMEWACQVKDGEVPADRRPIDAGYEADGRQLFFARHCPSDPYRYGKRGYILKRDTLFRTAKNWSYNLATIYSVGRMHDQVDIMFEVLPLTSRSAVCRVAGMI